MHCFIFLLMKTEHRSNRHKHHTPVKRRQRKLLHEIIVGHLVLSSVCVKVEFISQNVQVFNNLIELVTSCGNYSQYRKRFSECSGFRFPILGVHLKDLIAVHVALPDWVDKEKTRVNLTKTHQLYAILQELALVQNTPPSIDANTDLLNLLTVTVETGCPNPPLGK